MTNIINLLSEIIIEHLSLQIKNGADIIQIFDTHSNLLDYNSAEEYSINPIIKICKEIKKAGNIKAKIKIQYCATCV